MVTLKDFFVLSTMPPVGKYAYFVDAASKIGWQERYSLIRGERKQRKPVAFKISQGATLRDFQCNSAMEHVVSERVRNLFEASGFTGWREYPVRLLDRKNDDIGARYYGLSITGRVGFLDRKRSVTRTTPSFHKGRPASIDGIRGLYFNVKQWDASDLCLLRDCEIGILVVTKRVVDALRTIRATGWEEVPVRKYKMGVQYT